MSGSDFNSNDLLRRGDVEAALAEYEGRRRDAANQDSLGRSKRWSEADFRGIDAVATCRDIVHHMKKAEQP